MALDTKKIRSFVEQWTGKGYERGESQMFWIQLLQQVLGEGDPYSLITFEDRVHIDHTAFIDGIIRKTHVLIEQKSITKELDTPIRQSDGSMLTPFAQAKRYASDLPYSERPRWIVTSNFREIWVYDMEKPHGEPEKIHLEDLEKEAHRLLFMVDYAREVGSKEEEISKRAGVLIGKIYDSLLPQYKDPTSPETLRWLNVLCVRLVFCLYSEDAGVFAEHQMFGNYLKSHAINGDIRKPLLELFEVLDTPIESRDPYLDDDLARFPYVAGGLFEDRSVQVPRFTPEITALLIRETSENIDWSGISPTIFGAIFESTLNPETRRTGGMHYTSEKNIHKVIDPLFMEGLWAEYEQLASGVLDAKTRLKLEALQKKLAGLRFFDPACGSGNFLTETYLSLRRLENKIISRLLGGQMILGDLSDPIQVKIDQFYGIEINDFAVTVAQTALWIAEAQMMLETEKIVQKNIDFFPLKSYAHVKEGNALRISWESLFEDGKMPDYIIGNPPFVGYSLQSAEQKEDMLHTLLDANGKPYKQAGKVDYVSGWYYKACQMMLLNSNVRTAFVSTNSITQGEQVAGLWEPLYKQFGIHIDFAHQTFQWDSESNQKAHVHCVIVGFSRGDKNEPTLYFPNGSFKVCKNINAYLVAGPEAFVDSRSKPLCDVPCLTTGNRPADGGFLIIEGEEYEDFVRKEPEAKKWIKRLIGAHEFINNKARYCLWLVGISPAELRSMPLVYERVRLCREDRLGAPDLGRQKLADTPHLFRETNNPANAIVVPAASSEKREYIPLGFIDDSVITTNATLIIPNATIFHFGVLTSSVHMAWMRAVCGRLKSDYRYSKDIVYNNFPWPTPTEEQKLKIEQTAQAILDARALYPDSSLAFLYDEVTMPIELRKAHQANDRAVMAAYGFPKDITESEIVARLLEMYQALTK